MRRRVKLRRTSVAAGLITTVLGASPASAQQQVTVTITLNIAATATVDTAKVQAATKSAITGLLSQRANVLASSGPDTKRMHERLSGGTLFGGATETPSSTAPAPGFAAHSSDAFGARGIFDRYSRGGTPVGSAFGALATRDGAAHMSPLDRFIRGPNETIGRPESGLGLPSIFQQAGPDDGSSGARAAPLGFALNGSGDDTSGRFQFATSLSKLRAAAQDHEREKLASLDKDAVALTSAATSDLRGHARPALFDIWLEGSSSYFKTDRPDGARNGHAAVVLAGVDMLLRPGLLVGVLAQVDWMADSSSTLGQARDGRGWMAGPYISSRLTPNLYFDARAAWGRSSNHIDPVGAYVDTFETTRQLASARLTGDWSHDAWRLRPSAEVVWFTETQNAYVNRIGIDIAANTFSLGRMIVGPEIGYRILLSDKSVLEPTIGLKGVWDFSRSTETTAAGTPVGGDDLRGRVEGGVTYSTPAGIAVSATGAFDGLGSDGYRAVKGQARLRVPLQ